jgi:hypothetical protein
MTPRRRRQHLAYCPARAAGPPIRERALVNGWPIWVLGVFRLLREALLLSQGGSQPRRRAADDDRQTTTATSVVSGGPVGKINAVG